MNSLRPVAITVVLANVALVSWLLLRDPASAPASGVGEALRPLVDDVTMDAAQYDLSARASSLNVVLVSLDALRFDRTGASGNADGLTPNLDRFADEAVVFHDATAAAPWTVPSHMAVWTARWPSIHGVTNKLKLLSQDQMVDAALSPGIETFPDHLVRAGLVAAAFTGGAGVKASFGYGRGFDTYLDDRPFAGMDYSLPPALDWLGKNRDRRFFLFLHGYDVHGQHPLLGLTPRDAVPDYQGTLDGSIEEQARLRELGLAAIQKPGDDADLTGTLSAEDARFLLAVYDRKVRQMDQHFGTFVAQLRALDLLDRSIIVVFSDHGEEFMEHKYIDHGATLCQHQLHVPLMIRFPGYARRHDVKTPVRTIDIFPTIFDALDLAGPSGVDGRSLLPLLRGQPLDLPVYAETDYRLFVHRRMARADTRKLLLDLEDGQRELFDLAADPGETRDLSSSEARAAYELEQALRGWMERTRTNPQDYLGIRQTPIALF
ncbi:MAG: sulfatase [Deltaproteobacteria bacterium]|nr:sulfatase [Deltaproteobacteria bacterium]